VYVFVFIVLSVDIDISNSEYCMSSPCGIEKFSKVMQQDKS